MSYFSLHNHTDKGSNQRLIDTINRVDSLLQRCYDLGFYGAAITDHESLSAHVSAENFINNKRKEDSNWEKFKLIRGNEIYLCRNGLTNDTFIKGSDYFPHFILLAKDARGHQQLRELSTIAYKRSFVKNTIVRPLNYFADLRQIIEKDRGHIIGSSACLGSMIDNMLLRDEPMDKVYAFIDFIQKVLGKDNFYLELQPSAQKEQLKVNKMLLELSKNTGVKTIITTDSHMLSKEDLPLHKAFLNSKDGDREVDSFYSSAYTMDADEIHQYLDDNIGIDAVNKCLENTIEIGNQIEEYSIQKPFKLPFMPLHTEETTVLPKELENNESFLRFLNSKEQSDRIFVTRVVNFMEHGDKWFNRDFWFKKENIEKLSVELDYLWISSEKQQMTWTKYLLQMADYIEIIWRDADTIIAPGRGSAVSETLNYILGITQINPLAEKAPMKCWRFINPERASILDIDTDVQSDKRNRVIQALQNQYGEFNVVRVMTQKTEASRSAILTSARGLGIDNDISSYIANMIVSDRGQQRSLRDTYYGNVEKDFAPNSSFVEEMHKYPELWGMAQRIEGLVTGQSSHAGGVIIYDTDITDTNSLMKLKSGDYVTAYDLHESESLSDVKIDMLATEGLVRIRTCLDLLTDTGYIDKNLSLKERYFNIIGPYNLNRDNIKMWEDIWNGKVINLFQMEADSGRKGIKLIHPKTVEELAVLNSVIRLMAPEKGAEQPIEMWARYRANISDWHNEMRDYGLKQDDIDWLANHPAITDGMAESQESLMVLLQEERLGGHSLGFVDKCRKAIAKKQGKLFEECENIYFTTAAEKNCDSKLINYVWNVMLKIQRGYSFNLSHTLSYSIIGLQEMNLAHFYPTIYWNTANLIVDSASADNDESNDDNESEPSEEVVSIYEPEDYDEYDYIDLPDRSGKIKKVKKTVDYGKVATAISRFQSYGVTIVPPNINISNYTFTPDEKNNIIMYGLHGITRISNELIDKIIATRPFTSVNDFISKTSPNVLQMINLIKSGAFDNLDSSQSREDIMREYIDLIAERKTTLNLRNMAGLINYNILPAELNKYIKLFNFNKWLKNYKVSTFYHLNDSAARFIGSYFDEDLIVDSDKIYCKDWDRVYKNSMKDVSEYLKSHQAELLIKFNQALFDEQWQKYASGNISSWEMDSISFYYHEHELNKVNRQFDNFNMLPEVPIENNSFYGRNGETYKTYNLNVIAGTVINKDKLHSTVTLLTQYGVVGVKIYKNQFADFDKQISRKDANGVKHVIDKSWLTKGTILMIQGFRRDDNFVPKKYKSSVYPVISRLYIRDDGSIDIQYEREEE